MQENSGLGVAQAYLAQRLSTRTTLQQQEMSVPASDEIAGIRAAVLVESISLTEGQARQWGMYLKAVRELPEGEDEAKATTEILQRAALPITAVMALRNQWRFGTPGEAFSAFWSESRNAVGRFDPLRGRLRFGAFLEETLQLRAEAIAEGEQGERKLQERLDSLQAWIDDLGLSVNTDAETLFGAIKTSCEEGGLDLKRQYFHTLTRVRNTLEVLQTRGHTILSLDYQEEEGTGSLADTLAVNEEETERNRLRRAFHEVYLRLEEQGKVDGLVAISDHLNTLLEAAARGQQWLKVACATLGVDSELAQEAARELGAFYKSAL